jgi:hypothetical protein
MMGNKYGMPSHRSLFPIILRERRRQSGGDKIDSMGSDGVDALVLDVEAVLVR